jgi:hypothetical protein
MARGLELVVGKLPSEVVLEVVEATGAVTSYHRGLGAVGEGRQRAWPQ